MFCNLVKLYKQKMLSSALVTLLSNASDLITKINQTAKFKIVLE